MSIFTSSHIPVTKCTADGLSLAHNNLKNSDTRSCNCKYVHCVNKNPSALNFLSQNGSDVRYSCHHNSSRFTFPIFAHSCPFPVLHSLQSINLVAKTLTTTTCFDLHSSSSGYCKYQEVFCCSVVFVMSGTVCAEWHCLCWVALFVLSGTVCAEWHCLCWVALFVLSGTLCTEWHCLCWVALFVLLVAAALHKQQNT